MICYNCNSELIDNADAALNPLYNVIIYYCPNNCCTVYTSCCTVCTSDRIITGYMGKAHSKAYTVWGCRPGDDPNSGDTSLYCQPTHQQLIQIDYIPLEIIDNIPRIDLIIDRLLALQVFL